MTTLYDDLNLGIVPYTKSMFRLKHFCLGIQLKNSNSGEIDPKTRDHAGNCLRKSFPNSLFSEILLYAIMTSYQLQGVEKNWPRFENKILHFAAKFPSNLRVIKLYNRQDKLKNMETSKIGKVFLYYTKSIQRSLFQKVLRVDSLKIWREIRRPLATRLFPFFFPLFNVTDLYAIHNMGRKSLPIWVAENAGWKMLPLELE